MVQTTETRFLYSVYPKLPIKKVIAGVPVLRVNKSLYLTKEEVAGCLKFGTVQRRFANENKIEKVTPSNLDRLHNAKYMTEEEYEKFKKSQISDNRGSIIDATPILPKTVVEEPVVTTTTEEPVVEETEEVIVIEPVVEQTTEEVTNTEEVVEETNNTEEIDDEIVVEPVVEETTEEVVTEPVEIVVEEKQQSGFQYNNGGKPKNKKHH